MLENHIFVLPLLVFRYCIQTASFDMLQIGIGGRRFDQNKFGDSLSRTLVQRSQNSSNAAERVIAQSRSDSSSRAADETGEAVPAVEASSFSGSPQRTVVGAGARGSSFNPRMRSSSSSGGGIQSFPSRRSNLLRSSMIDAAMMPMLQTITVGRSGDMSEAQRTYMDVDKVKFSTLRTLPDPSSSFDLLPSLFYVFLTVKSCLFVVLVLGPLG